MAKQDSKSVKKKIQEQKDEYYGDETPTGSSTDSDPENTKDMLKDIIGNEPSEESPFSIADEVDKDEKNI